MFEGNTILLMLALFDADQEVSIPTWYSQLLLAAAGLAAILVGRAYRAARLRDGGYWHAIGFLLIYMSLDEGSSIHEIASGPMRLMLGSEGTVFHQAWSVLGVFAVIVVGVVFLKFWWRLPARPKKWLFAAAGVYVLGAVGFEIVGGYVLTNISPGLKYSAFVVFEESLEMLGAIFALRTPLHCFEHMSMPFGIEFGSS